MLVQHASRPKNKMLVQHDGLAAKLVRLVSQAIRTTLKLVQMDIIWTSFKLVRLTSFGFPVQSSECDWKPIEECKSLLTAYLDSKVSTHGTTVMSSAPESVKQARLCYA